VSKNYKRTKRKKTKVLSGETRKTPKREGKSPKKGSEIPKKEEKNPAKKVKKKFIVSIEPKVPSSSSTF
jgi:hypothetical protein